MTEPPIAILAFDHRAEFSRSVFDRDPEQLPPQEFAMLSRAKSLVFEGFLAALPRLGRVRGGILADEEFGGAVLDRSQERDYLLAVPVERADQRIFEFDYGDDFLEHITRYSPDYAKALVRLSINDEAESIDLQLARLRRLADALASVDIGFMFELIVRPSGRELQRVDRDPRRFEDELRPETVRETMRLVQEAGIAVDVWKLQGIATQHDADAIAQQARSANPDAICIVLGAAADPGRVDDWLDVAASTHGFAGFAFGRNIWREVLRRWSVGAADSAEVIERVAQGYLDYIDSYLGTRARQ
ncbi:MAG: hypothetical protein DI534_04855 [Leifsonia xyli]|nr:MAG: hypothetical protein DI534_04855 [Leifsonia xyli]